VSAVTPEARQQAANRVAYAIRTQAPWSGSDDLALVVVGQMIADGWSPPVTPEATELDPLPWIDMDSGVRFARQNRLTLGYTMLPRRIFDQDRSHYPEGGKP
jgi:hypothetical protein